MNLKNKLLSGWTVDLLHLVTSCAHDSLLEVVINRPVMEAGANVFRAYSILRIMKRIRDVNYEPTCAREVLLPLLTSYARYR
jgi:hypothetical protein